MPFVEFLYFWKMKEWAVSLAIIIVVTLALLLWGLPGSLRAQEIMAFPNPHADPFSDDSFSFVLGTQSFQRTQWQWYLNDLNSSLQTTDPLVFAPSLGGGFRLGKVKGRSERYVSAEWYWGAQWVSAPALNGKLKHSIRDHRVMFGGHYFLKRFWYAGGALGYQRSKARVFLDGKRNNDAFELLFDKDRFFDWHLFRGISLQMEVNTGIQIPVERRNDLWLRVQPYAMISMTRSNFYERYNWQLKTAPRAERSHYFGVGLQVILVFGAVPGRAVTPVTPQRPKIEL